MPTDDQNWRKWGPRFKVLAKENGSSLADVAEKLKMSESGVRSWTNGTRQINLSDFFALCAAAKVDPSQALFGRVGLSVEQKAKLGELLTSVLETDSAIHPDYPAMAKSLQSDLKLRRKK